MNTTANRITLGTLNVWRGFHGLTKALNFLTGSGWEIACILDVRENHLSLLRTIFPGACHFAPMGNHLINGAWVPVGNAILSRDRPFMSASAHAYVGQVSPPLNLDGVVYDAVGNARPGDSPEDLARLRATEARILSSVKIEVGGKALNVITTHGPWVSKGVPDDHQRHSIARLLGILRQKGGPLVFAGCLNFPRSDSRGVLYKTLATEGVLDDCVPTDVKNSFDWQTRGSSGPDILTSYILKEGQVSVSDVKMHTEEHVSHHYPLSCVVSV